MSFDTSRKPSPKQTKDLPEQVFFVLIGIVSMFADFEEVGGAF